MIVAGRDARNITVIMDIVHAKMILEILRFTTVQQVVVASSEVQKQGFTVFGTDAEAARLNAASVLGQYLDPLVHVSKVTTPPRTPPEPASSPCEEDGESSPPPKPELIN